MYKENNMSSFRRFAKKNDLDETLYTGHIVKNAMDNSPVLDEPIASSDPSVSDWVREQYQLLLQRDPVDALRDVNALLNLIEDHTQGQSNHGFGTGEEVLKNYGFPGIR
jgi:hypothetical protein